MAGTLSYLVQFLVYMKKTGRRATETCMVTYMVVEACSGLYSILRHPFQACLCVTEPLAPALRTHTRFSPCSDLHRPFHSLSGLSIGLHVPALASLLIYLLSIRYLPVSIFKRKLRPCYPSLDA